MEKARVLIIEDEWIVAHDLEDLLSQAEYEIVGTESSGEEAIEKAKVTNPDLVLADIKLVGTMDGIEAAERIRENADCAIVYLTACTELDTFKRAKKSEPYGYLTKPIVPQELLRAVEMALYKHEMETRLRKSQRRFRAIFDQTFQFIGLMTPDGILLEANRAALAFYGLDEADVIGLPFWESPWWTHSTELQAMLREAIQKAAGGEFVRFEASHPTPDGELHYVDVSIKPVKDDVGNVTLLIPEGRDITDRKKAEEALRASEAQFRAIYENAPVMIDSFSRDGELLLWNKEIERTLGWTREEAATSDVLSLCYPDPETCQHVKETISLADGKFREYSPIAKNGSQRHQLWANFALPDGRIISVGHDITDRKRAEEQREKAILELEKSLAELKKLSGLLPICASCKKIRDDQGYWQQIEAYIRDHSEAEFSHGICPDCAKKLYPKFHGQDHE